MRFLLVTLLFACVSAVLAYDSELLANFNAWQVKFSKTYHTPEEFDHAMQNFEASIARVAAGNRRVGHNLYGLTKFSDLSPAEFKKYYLTRKPTAKAHREGGRLHKPTFAFKNITLPSTFDWRNQKPNPVTAVKDQGQCGSCWAFSATESTESFHILKGHTAVALAPEQIVDCDTVDQGCNGGDLPTAYQYITTAGGLETEKAYPYTAGDSGSGGQCQFDASKVAAKINGFNWVIPECEDSCNSQHLATVQQELVTTGPFAICVNAEPWQDYTGGIFNDPTCGHAYSDLDHCVQLVGFDNDKKYMIVRNSWNTDWGVDGYIHISTSVANGNLCGILDEVAYPNSL